MQKDAEKNESKFLNEFGELADRRVLEVGCGDGRLTWKYAETTRSTLAFDPDFDSLRVARADRPANLADKVHLLRAESEHLPLPGETFDRAVLAWSL